MALKHRELIADTHWIAALAVPGYGESSIGTIDPVGFVEVEDGASQAFTITPFSDYEDEGGTIYNYFVKELLVDGQSESCDPGGCTYTFPDTDTENHTIQAIFGLQVEPPEEPHWEVVFPTSTIDARAEAGGSILPFGDTDEDAPGVKAEDYGSREFRIIPEPGYRIKDVLTTENIDDIANNPWLSQGPLISYTLFDNITSTVKGIKAQFVENQVKLAIVKKKCVDEETGIELSTGCEGVNSRISVNGEYCGPGCEVITVSFSGAISVILEFEPGDSSNAPPGSTYPNTTLKRWETADGTEIQGVIERQEDFIVRPVIGCSGG
jgi:hypothetical protein